MLKNDKLKKFEDLLFLVYIMSVYIMLKNDKSKKFEDFSFFSIIYTLIVSLYTLKTINLENSKIFRKIEIFGFELDTSQYTLLKAKTVNFGPFSMRFHVL